MRRYYFPMDNLIDNNIALFPEWSDKRGAEGIHAGYGVHHQHPGVVVSVQELVGGIPLDCPAVSRSPGTTETNSVAEMTV